MDVESDEFDIFIEYDPYGENGWMEYYEIIADAGDSLIFEGTEFDNTPVLDEIHCALSKCGPKHFRNCLHNWGIHSAVESPRKLSAPRKICAFA